MNLINTLRMYAEDMHSAFGHGYCSEAMSRAADLLEAQVGTITALNIALGGKDSTSTENLVDSHEIDIADVGLITMCRKLMAEISELEASPLSEEALDILRSKNKQLEQERVHWKANHDTRVEAARFLIERPDMPVERIKAYKQYLAIAAQNEAMREALYKLACLGNDDAIIACINKEELDAVIDAAIRARNEGGR